jgi:hypothetical protein
MSDPSAIAIERLEDAEREHPESVRLARLASLAVRVDSPLLRRLRLELLPDADVGSEADLWFSTLIESRGADFVVLEAAVARLLQDSLARDAPMLAAATKITLDAHRDAPAAIQLEERITAIALSGAPDAVEQIDRALQPALRALALGGDRALEVSRWMLRAFTRAHPLVRRSDNMAALALAASYELRGRRVMDGVPAASGLIGNIAWALPHSLMTDRIEVGVLLAGDVMAFVDATQTDQLVSLPNTNPPLVSAEWSNEGNQRHAFVEAARDVTLHLGSAVSSLTLRTLAGDEYQLAALTSESQGSQETATEQLPASMLESCVRITRSDNIAGEATGFFIDPVTVVTASGPFVAGDELPPTLLIHRGDWTAEARVIQPHHEVDDDVLVLELTGTGAAIQPLTIADAAPEYSSLRVEPATIIAGGDRPTVMNGIVHRVDGRDRITLEFDLPIDAQSVLGAPLLSGHDIAGVVTAIEGGATRPGVSVALAPRIRVAIALAKHHDYAIVVGVSKYAHLEPVTGAEESARLFLSWVSAENGAAVSPDRARLLLSPTKEVFEASIMALLPSPSVNSRQGRRLYIYASGNGFGRPADALLATPDASPTLALHIPLRRYADWVREAAVFDEIVLIADLRRIEMPSGPVSDVPFASVRGVVRQASYFYSISDGPDLGTLTRFLIEGLNGGAADRHGNVTSESLAAYVAASARARQKQAAHFEHNGAIVLARAATAVDREGNDVAEVMLDVGPQIQRTRVLVAGTGQYNLPESVQWLSTAVARMLAESGCMLIVGGYEGVDHIVAREFVSALRARDHSLRGRILQVGRALGETDFYDPEVEQVPGGAAEYEMQLTSADAAILIGGVGGVYETFERAVRRGVAMIPLPASGGDALKAFNDLSRGDLTVPAAIRERLLSLNAPVTSPQDATELAGRVRELLLALADNGATERAPKEQASPRASNRSDREDTAM